MTSTFAEPTWGEVDPAALARIVVVSPHFDDAAMGAGHLIASYHNTTVITVLAGRPPSYPEEPSDWDALGGFVAGDDVVAVRREEDVAAMAVLESGYRWLDFADHQYLLPEDRPTPDEVAPVLGATIAELDPTAVFFPMGLGNPDHVMVHEASLLVRTGQPDREWFCYEDHGYKHIPGLLAWRVAKLLALAPLAHPRHRPARPRRGAQAPRHLVLHLADRTARAGPHALGPHGGARPRAVLAPGGSPRRGGRGWPTTSEPGRETTRPGGVGRVVYWPQ